QVAAVLIALHVRRSPEVQADRVQALPDGHQAPLVKDEVVAPVFAHDRPRWFGECFFLLQYLAEVALIELASEYLGRDRKRSIVPLRLSRFKASVPLGRRLQVEVLAKEAGQFQRPLVKELMQGGLKGGSQRARQTREDSFRDGKRGQIHGRIHAEKSKEVTQQRFWLAGNGFVEAHIQLLAGEHRQPAPQLPEVVAAGKGPLVGEV